MDSTGSGGGGVGSKWRGGDGHLESGGYWHDNHRNLRNHRVHQEDFSLVALRILLLFTVIGTMSLLLDKSIYTTKFFQSYSFSGSKQPDKGMQYFSSSCHNGVSVQQDALSSFHQFTKQNPATSATEEKRLEETLRKAVMKDNKTVIITTLNAAWTEPNSLFDLFLEGFRIGNGTQNLLKHVVVGAMDHKAYARCVEENLHCYAIITDGIDFSGHQNFMTADYLKMMWRRTDFLSTVVELGFDFVFTDADVMWLRDPFPRFDPDADFQIACDHHWYESTNVKNIPNGGFLYVKSNDRTIWFYKLWCLGKIYFPELNEQDVFNILKKTPLFGEIGLKVWFLETAYFGGFCEPSRDLDLVVTMHANCCVGLGNKTHDINMVIDDWKRYTILNSGGKRRKIPWTLGRICGNY